MIVGLCSRAQILPPGHRPAPPGVHALAGGKIVIKPGETLESGTIIIRDGLIEAVGSTLEAPADSRIWPMQGLTIYAGLIDPYLVLKPEQPPVSTSKTEDGPAGSLGSRSLNFYGVPGQERDPGKPGPGSEIASITPEHRVADDLAPDQKILNALRELGFTAGNVAPTKGVVRGTGAFVQLSDDNPNQAILKSDLFQHIAFEAETGKEDVYPRSLMGVIAAVRQTFLDAEFYLRDHHHYQHHPHGRPRPAFDPALQALRPAIQKKMRVVFEPGSALMTDRAARIARELQLDFLLLASGQEWRRPDLAKQSGATFIVPLHFPELPKLPEEDDWEQINLDQLRAWDWAPENPALLRREGLEIALTTYGLGDRKDFRNNLRLALDRGLSEDDALAALTVIPAKLCGLENQLGTIEKGKIANLTVVDGASYFNPENKVREVWIDGRVYAVNPGETKLDYEKNHQLPDQATLQAERKKKEDEKAQRESRIRNLHKKRAARFPLDGRGAMAAPPAIWIRNGTLWTCGPSGVMQNADLLIVSNRIQAVGRDLNAPADVPGPLLVINAQDQHVTPGLIDAHNHSFILGGVNENTIPSTAMVRISDVINSESDNIYKQLAGGLTVANLLHGSANPIGGQNAVIKLRDGAAPHELVFKEAPPGIKFALGENVKQSNWGQSKTNRFPQTRMGVRTFMANRFIAAEQHMQKFKHRSHTSDPPPVRRDLELETLAEILQGKRWIHCHSYRQDEILAFLRLMEGLGIKVASLQHVLEGYKIADEIAAHGAGASCFSDWWAYKFEVYDAIPYAGSLMRERGVVVSFNSDSSDLARRLYLEAAKAVKYGDTPEPEALRFLTLNPAKQLRIDHRVGSLEAGKDADFVLWSKSPLDSRTLCDQTWIDGKKYFDRAMAGDRAKALQEERKALLIKAKKIAGIIDASDRSKGAARERFFRLALEHQFDAVDRHCEDE